MLFIFQNKLKKIKYLVNTNKNKQMNLKAQSIPKTQLILNPLQQNNKIMDKSEKKHKIIKKFLIFSLFIILIGLSFTTDLNSYHSKTEKPFEMELPSQKSHIKDLQYLPNHKINAQSRILSDTQINTWTANNQEDPSIASLSDNNIVVVWESYLQNGNGFNIYGQIFYSNGAKKGNEFPITNYTNSIQTNPKVAASSAGKFMVVWMTQESASASAPNHIYGKIFLNNGTKSIDELLINTYIPNSQEGPSITALKNGNFVITWWGWSIVATSSYNIFAQIFRDDGIKVGIEFLVDTYTSNNHGGPKVTSLPNGNFVVAWVNYAQDCNSEGVFAQIFYSNGSKAGLEFPVNTYCINDQINPSLSSVSTSNFMIVWQSSGQDGSGSGIYGQIYTSSGATIGNEFRVNTNTIGDQINPSITTLINDNYIVLWQSSDGIYGQIFDIIGNKIGGEIKVTSSLGSPSISSIANSNFVVLWNSLGQDNSQNVYGNLYQIDGLMIGFNACPLNCQSCYNNINCTVCDPNFVLQTNSLCGCSNGFYLDIILNICTGNLFN